MGRALALMTLLLVGFAALADEPPAELVRLADPAGLARLIRMPGTEGGPLVVMLPDALGEDGRTEPYVGSLLARGIASLVLGLGEDADAPGPSVEPAAAPEAIAPALAWARAAGFDLGRIGLLGFGLGGRAVLAGSAGLPAAAVYPGCRALNLPEDGPVLVLQGADVAEGCAALPARPDLEIRLLPGAGHGWDVPGAIWPSSGPILPDPAGGPRLHARADLSVTLDAAEALADWFEGTLLDHVRRAGR